MIEREEESTLQVMRLNVQLRLTHMRTTQREAAKEHGYHVKAMSTWMRTKNPRLSTIEAMADVCCVPSWALLDPEFNPREWPFDDDE